MSWRKYNVQEKKRDIYVNTDVMLKAYAYKSLFDFNLSLINIEKTFLYQIEMRDWRKKNTCLLLMSVEHE